MVSYTALPNQPGTAEDVQCSDAGMERRESSLLPSAAAKGLKGAFCAPEWKSRTRSRPAGGYSIRNQVKTMKAFLQSENPRGDLGLSLPYPAETMQK